MILETIIAGLTTIFVSSLIFANAQIKRQRQWDKEDAQEDEDVCGREAEKNNGLRQAKSCDPKQKCETTVAHLHCECTWCNSKWLMRPADYRAREKNDH